jgi:NAD(P)-dependent dehydrogenase (short-subunit alcohol dehydrogenase family)
VGWPSQKSKETAGWILWLESFCLATRPLPCRDTGRAIALSPHQNLPIFALVSSFSVGFDGFDKSGALIFNNAPSRALRFPGTRKSQRCGKTVTHSRTQRVALRSEDSAISSVTKSFRNLSSVEDTPLSEFRAQIETNLFGTIIVTKAALRYFREKKAGQFIQFSSVGGRIGPPGRGPYSAAKWGVEGFSEVLSREVAPLGIKVTIVEPGGFRTDFAGSSTELSEGHPEYDSTVGATARFQRNYNGKQPGDPKKAAQAIVQLTQERNPPLRLLLGSDAYAAAEKNDLARLEEARIWKKLSVSTDFETK